MKKMKMVLVTGLFVLFVGLTFGSIGNHSNAPGHRAVRDGIFTDAPSHLSVSKDGWVPDSQRYNRI